MTSLKTEPRYRVVIEPTSTGFSAYVPDLPGCVATGRYLQIVADRIQGAIELHLAGMREDGDPIPAPGSHEAEKDFHGHGPLGDD
jgi:predicted RNase H-like HicB family nuclease